ncbi:MAG: PucR family transcriptional regulator [Lachnospiraceae bacterium]
MNVVQAMQKSLEDLKVITRTEFALYEIAKVYDMQKEAVSEVCTAAFPEITPDVLRGFAASMADSQEISSSHLFKVQSSDAPEYILAVRSAYETAYLIGKIGASQLENLLLAYEERSDLGSFIQNLLLDNLLAVDIYNSAKKLQIEMEQLRGVFVIETPGEREEMAFELVRSLFAEQDFVIAVDERHVILVKQLQEQQSGIASPAEQMTKTANLLLDMLNSEAMLKVRIGYGSIVGELKELSKSYKEAVMSLNVGKIFYKGQKIISYEMLGIGRLIYQLPIHLCKIFINEIFPNGLPDEIDDEVLQTIHKFFENSLNISETARQLFIHRNTLVYRLEKIQKITGLDIRVFDDALTFQIALMVLNYMEYQQKEGETI